MYTMSFDVPSFIKQFHNTYILHYVSHTAELYCTEKRKSKWFINARGTHMFQHTGQKKILEKSTISQKLGTNCKTLTFLGSGGGRAYFEKFCMWICLLDFKMLTIQYFVPIYHPSIYQFCIKTPNSAQIGCFSPSLAKNTPNLCKLDTFHLWWPPSSLY